MYTYSFLLFYQTKPLSHICGAHQRQRKEKKKKIILDILLTSEFISRIPQAHPVTKALHLLLAYTISFAWSTITPMAHKFSLIFYMLFPLFSHQFIHSHSLHHPTLFFFLVASPYSQLLLHLKEHQPTF